MKRLICMLASLVLAVTVIAVRPAEATYLGTLQQSGGYTIEVRTTDKVAATFLLVTSRGRLDVEETLVFDATMVGQQRTIPRNVDRIIIKLDARIRPHSRSSNQSRVK